MIPTCEEINERLQARYDAVWDMIVTCSNHEFTQCETKACGEVIDGKQVCFYTGCLEDPILIPEPALGVALALGMLTLVFMGITKTKIRGVRRARERFPRV